MLPDLIVDLSHDGFERRGLERRVVEVAVHDLLVLVHPIDHQPLDLRLHRQLEVVERVGHGALDHLAVLLRLLR